MILPTKHIKPDRALLAIGAEMLQSLREPMTVSRLWDEVRRARENRAVSAPVNYDWYVLALDLLFLLGAVEFEQGLITKAAR